MIALVRNVLRMWLLPLLSVVWIVGCYPAGMLPDLSSSSSGGDGTGGSSAGPCGVNCAGFKTPECTVAVCNTGQVAGPLNTCIVVPAEDGSLCDDGQFCTVTDFCDKGTCVGGAQNDCGMGAESCSSVICYEDTKSCSVTPANDGTACTPTDLCQIDGVCKVGDCVGVSKDCSSTPMNECNQVTCGFDHGKLRRHPRLQQGRQLVPVQR